MTKYKILLCIFVALSLLANLARSAETATLGFDAANKLYEQGKFVEAAAAYEKLIQSGQTSAANYFNLGNAAFKSGQIGRAVVAYHQAQKISPRDPDIRANLQFARNQIQGPGWTPNRWQRWLGKLTLNEWTVLAAGAVWVLLLLLAGLHWRPALWRSLRGLVVTMVILAVMLCCCLGAAWAGTRSERTAVVVIPNTAVHNGPFDESPTAFRLSDGAELQVLDEKGDWLQVTADGRRIGWLRKDKIIAI